jgi:hypothetical protein
VWGAIEEKEENSYPFRHWLLWRWLRIPAFVAREGCGCSWELTIPATREAGEVTKWFATESTSRRVVSQNIHPRNRKIYCC